VRKSRQSLTQTLCDLAKKYPVDYATAMKTWWWNKYSGNSLRLTVDGFLTLTDDVGLEYYTWRLEEPLRVTPQILLKLDRKLENPYYVRFGGKKEMFIHALILFAEKEATYLNLVDDLNKFLDSL